MNHKMMVASLVLLLFPAIGQAQGIRGVASAGKGITDKWCSACHLVTPDQARANADVPTFSSLAQRLPTDADFLSAFIANPHPPMPNMGLSRQDIADVLAYIATLK